MNSISWIIYLVDILSGLSGLFGGLALTTIIVYFAFLIACGAHSDISTSRYDIDYFSIIKKYTIVAVSLMLLFGILSFLSPSPRAVYIIAASEVGEEVIRAPETQEMLNLFRDKLKKELLE